MFLNKKYDSSGTLETVGNGPIQLEYLYILISSLMHNNKNIISKAVNISKISNWLFLYSFFLTNRSLIYVQIFNNYFIPIYCLLISL